MKISLSGGMSFKHQKTLLNITKGSKIIIPFELIIHSIVSDCTSLFDSRTTRGLGPSNDVMRPRAESVQSRVSMDSGFRTSSYYSSDSSQPYSDGGKLNSYFQTEK